MAARDRDKAVMAEAAPSERLRTQVRLVARLLSDLAVFRDIDAPWCPEMVALPVGEFLMGSLEDEEGYYSDEGPQHRVTIGRRFTIGPYPVTFEEYDHFRSGVGGLEPAEHEHGPHASAELHLAERQRAAGQLVEVEAIRVAVLAVLRPHRPCAGSRRG
ncbi:MAG: formylglycine-generating enzyme family protein [Candidatus Binatia bacterium]